MFQRIKGAIDRTIAEEQARARDQSPGATAPRASSSVSRSNSGASTVRKARPKKSGQDAAKDADAGAADTDPAVFEAAFVIDDEEPSRSATPMPLTSQDNKNVENGDAKDVNTAEGGNGGTGTGNNVKDPEKNDVDEGRKSEGDRPIPPPKATTTDLPPDVRAKLRKLEKLEKTYPGQSVIMSEAR